MIPFHETAPYTGLGFLSSPRQTLRLPVSVPFPLLPLLSICVPSLLHDLLRPWVSCMSCSPNPVAPHQRGTLFYVNVSSYLSACFLRALYILGRQSPVCCVILTHYSLLSSQNVCFWIDGFCLSR